MESHAKTMKSKSLFTLRSQKTEVRSRLLEEKVQQKETEITELKERWLESTPALPPVAWSRVTNEPIVVAPNLALTRATNSIVCQAVGFDHSHQATHETETPIHPDRAVALAVVESHAA